MVVLAGFASAADRLLVPGEHPGPPIYARPLEVDPDWVAFIFYRPPDCVPPEFNLNAFFDVPRLLDPPPGCGMLMDGFLLIGPGASVPRQMQLHGRGTPVPIWFVRAEELFNLIDPDGEGPPYRPLTIRQLVELRPLVGWATDYHEVLHPSEVVKAPIINVQASGVLQHGGTFTMHFLNSTGRKQPESRSLRFGP